MIFNFFENPRFKDVDPICVALHCGISSATCVADPACSKVLGCLTGCAGQPDEAACQFVCQWQYGKNNQHYLDLLKCMADNHCLTMQPDGICYGDSVDTDATVTTLDQVRFFCRKFCLFTVYVHNEKSWTAGSFFQVKFRSSITSDLHRSPGFEHFQNFGEHFRLLTHQ